MKDTQIDGVDGDDLIEEVGRGVIDLVESPSGNADHSIQAVRLIKVQREIGRTTALEKCP